MLKGQNPSPPPPLTPAAKSPPVSTKQDPPMPLEGETRDLPNSVAWPRKPPCWALGPVGFAGNLHFNGPFELVLQLKTPEKKKEEKTALDEADFPVFWLWKGAETAPAVPAEGSGQVPLKDMR